VVSSSEDGTLCAWEVASGISRTLGSHDGSVYAVAFSPDVRQVVTGSRDGTLRLWEVASGISSVLGHHDGVRAVAFSPDGYHVASGDEHRTLRLWDVETRLPLRWVRADLLPDWVHILIFSPDGRHVISDSAYTALRLQLATGQEVARLDGDFGFLALHLAPDGRNLAAGDSGGRVHLIDIILDEADKAAWLASRRG
jgi:WD40 repeat protein